MAKKLRKKKTDKSRSRPRGTSASPALGAAVLSLMAIQSESLMNDIHESQGIPVRPKSSQKPRHNDPDVAAKYRAERLAKKLARAEALRKKKS